jgi:hypothetical protein
MVISMTTPSGVFESPAGVHDVNEFGSNQEAWRNFSALAAAGTPSSTSRVALEHESMSLALRALATDYHDSMEMAA